MSISHNAPHMAATLKRKQVRIYLDSTNEEHLSKIMGRLKTLSESSLVTEMVAAALESCAAYGYRLHLPLKFEIKEHEKLPTKPKK